MSERLAGCKVVILLGLMASDPRQKADGRWH